MLRRSILSCAIPILVAVLPSAAYPQSKSPDLPVSAADLARKALDNEVRALTDDHSHWSFRSTTGKSGRRELKAVVQTNDGELDRLLSVNGQPLTSEEEKKESTRIQELVNHPSHQRKRHKDQQKDVEQMVRVLKLLPDALLFTYGEQRGSDVQLRFRPNPQFHPQSHEARVVNALSGEMWVNHTQDRVEQAQGHVAHEVRFLGGLAGHLEKGGQFQIGQSEVAPNHWEITALNIQVKGKALFFKTISLQQVEARNDFQRVADNLTLAEGAQILSHPTSLAQIHQ
jgi:hypothetical protein